MKWIKHMAATTDDERVSRLIGSGGQVGLARYGLYWRIQEIIASQMEGNNPSCSVSYPTSVWSRKLFTRGSLVFSTLSTLAVTGLVTVERDGDDIRVTNRNLLKYRDEYSKKSGHTTDNVPSRIEGEGEGDTEVDGEKNSSSKIKPSTDIEQEEKIYKAYCRQVGKEAALKAIRKAVERLVKGDKLHPPMDAYTARKLLWKKAKEYSLSPAGMKPALKSKDFRPHPATWFNQGHYFDDPIEWKSPNGNGVDHAKVSQGKSKGNLAVFAESTSGMERQETFNPDGLFPSGEDRPGNTGIIHGVLAPARPQSLPGGDGDPF